MTREEMDSALQEMIIDFINSGYGRLAFCISRRKQAMIDNELAGTVKTICIR